MICAEEDGIKNVHLSLNLLLHYLAKFNVTIQYTPIQQLFSSKMVQNPLLTVSIYDRW